MFKKYIVSLLSLFTILYGASSDYRYREYLHVKEFYQNFAKEAIQICLDYDVPPAAVLAMAAVESGYGRGYVSRISGNILSLGAGKSDARLPALYLPNLKEDPSVVLYGAMINKYHKNQLIWKKREKSLKKDYRPKNIAGTSKELDYFDEHSVQKKAANLACIRDFVKNWISKSKKYRPYKEAKLMLENAVKEGSKKVLFTRELNVKFLQMISGRKNSFNYRKTWAKKVIHVMDNAGLIELAKTLHVQNQPFEIAWLK